jgi:hypothetical protein
MKKKILEDFASTVTCAFELRSERRDVQDTLMLCKFLSFCQDMIRLMTLLNGINKHRGSKFKNYPNRQIVFKMRMPHSSLNEREKLKKRNLSLRLHFESQGQTSLN